MLSIKGLIYYIGGRPLYEKASLHINSRDKVGLIGINGSGKTTLLKIIEGKIAPDKGDITMIKEGTIGILGQEVSDIGENKSILEIAMEAFKPLLELKNKLDRLIVEIEHDPDDKKIRKLSDLQTEFEVKGGYALQSKAESILEGIGFRTEDLQRPIREFSGGWKMRVALARLLLEKPSLLMLDEPTNHLDLPSIQWFENYIRNYEGAVIIVSHDRQFLDNTIDKTIEIENCTLNQYNGNYSFYLEEKETRKEIRQNAYLNQQKKIKEAEKFINRFRAKATKARQVQSKIKLMSKIDLIENAQEHTQTIDFQFKPGKLSGKQVLEIAGLSKSYDNQKIFDKTSVHVHRDDKIALIGANGLGKTTLLKIIAGNESYEGQVQAGYNVLPAYYAQHQVESLRYENTVLEELLNEETGYTELELRSVLGSFLFTGEEVFKKIRTLSGGEKARVALAKTLITNANFLVLDEPTNHLDIHSVEILINALKDYKGSLIMVSHDRNFIEQVTNKIWYIENYKVKEYPGTLSEYIYWYNNVKFPERKKTTDSTKKNKKEEGSNDAYRERKEMSKKIRSIKRELGSLEKEINDQETRKTEVEELMAKPENYSDFEKLQSLTEQLQDIKNNLTDLHSRWEESFVALDELDVEDI